MGSPEVPTQRNDGGRGSPPYASSVMDAGRNMSSAGEGRRKVSAGLAALVASFSFETRSACIGKHVAYPTSPQYLTFMQSQLDPQ